MAPVWTVATKTKEGAKCNICGKIYSMPQGNTSNIMAHVKLKHKGNPTVKNMIGACKTKKIKRIGQKEGFGKQENEKFKNTAYYYYFR